MANVTTFSRKGLEGILKEMFEEHSEVAAVTSKEIVRNNSRLNDQNVGNH